MAKKKKKSKKKVEAESTGSPFWRQTFAFVMIILAIFIALGNFGVGGPFPSWLGKTASQGIFGGAAYLLPLALVYWAYHKIKSDDNRLPWPKLFSMLGVLISSSALIRVLGDSVDAGGSHSGTGGGAVGQAVGGVTVTFLSKMPGVIFWLFLLFVSFSYAFGIGLNSYAAFFRALFSGGDIGDDEEGVESLAELKGRMSTQSSFQMNEGVPVEHNPKRTVGALKNSADKLKPEESHAALTAASDPDWQVPPMNLLSQKQDKADAGDVEGNAQIIQDTFANFNIDVEMEGANIGPRVTQYTMKPPSNVKLTKITALDNNLALDLAAHSIRMEAPIPGKRAVGIEVPNVKAATVTVASVMNSAQWREVTNPLGFVIGKDIAGTPVVGILDKMPHLLVAGQTGSGKSVMINTLLTSLLYRNSPAELKLILVDPKQVEMAPYNDIPHLLTPVITEPEKCISALKWAVAEMERRLKTFANVSKRNIAEYNMVEGEENMPYIVIVIDELADLMMMAARDVEALIVRLAQKARAAGIHLVLATQRPSVDVITGLIKANIPARIAFTVASQVDSRTIIDGVGAEKLLGMGDMLFSTSDMPKPKRVQGALISDPETLKICDFLRMQRPPQYDDEVVSQPVQLGGSKGSMVQDYGANEADDDMWRDAVHVVIENKKASTSLLQRRLRIGYGRAARLIEQMEEQGIVGAADGSRPREVLVSSMGDVFGGGSGAAEPTDDVYADMPDES